jgi:hypothetical protein
MNAPDTELESTSSKWEFWEVVSATVVVLGLGLEVITAYVDPPSGSTLHRWGAVIADSMVALGVVGEVIFSKLESRLQTELRRRSNLKLAEAVARAGDANERAAKAHQKAAELEVQAATLRLQLMPRTISPEQREILLTLKGKVDSVGVTSFADSESTDFAMQIVEVLRQAGVNTVLYDPRVGLTWTGIYINFPRHLLDHTIDPIWNVFNKAGLLSGFEYRPQSALRLLPGELTLIMVGEKQGPPRLP